MAVAGGSSCFCVIIGAVKGCGCVVGGGGKDSGLRTSLGSQGCFLGGGDS